MSRQLYRVPLEAPTGGGANGTFKRDIESLVGDDEQETTAS